MRSAIATAFVVALWTGAPGAHADAIALGGNAVLEIEQSVGTGPDRAYLVVDFGNNGGGSYAFEYQFDSAMNVSAQTAWSTLVDQTDLQWTVQNFGSDIDPNLFITGLEYNGEGETPDFAVSQQSWVYWNGAWDTSASALDWMAAQAGMRDRVLTAGAFDGWRVTSYDPVTFEPLFGPDAPISIVPEPSAWPMLMFVLAGCLWSMRRTRAMSGVKSLPSPIESAW